MKISYMLKREDFYVINEQTLKKYFQATDKSTTLYIYPHLNAIVRAAPTKAVKEYIYTEYAVTASPLKRFLVWAYTRLCLNSFGLLAAKRVTIPAEITRDTLIYPCNRKFRIFDFKNQTVSVITKAGFSAKSLHNEIAFRTGCAPCDFVLPIDSSTQDTYTERIIDGIPLARLADNRSVLEKSALDMWQKYSASTLKAIPASQYADTLADRIAAFTERIRTEKPAVNTEHLSHVVKDCLSVLKNAQEEIRTIQSHGDLQAGNIWIENKTDRIYIIDWESVEQRSIWYDDAVLNDGIRNTACFDTFSQTRDLRHATVILEEIIYRMNELCELPFDYGTESFNLFIQKLEK